MSGHVTATAMLERVWAISDRLTRGRISHDIRGLRHDGITIVAHVPGAYWEIDFLEDGSVDVEIFRSTEPLKDESAIEQLLELHSEPTEKVKQCP